MCTETVVFRHATPMGIDHLRTLFTWTDTIHPVVFIGKTATRPTQVGDLDLFQGSNDIVTDTIRVGDVGIFTHPQTAINAMAEVFGKLSIDMTTDGHGTLIGIYREFGTLLCAFMILKN